MARRTDYNKMWSKKSKKGMKSLGALSKIAAGGTLFAGAAAVDMVRENHKYAQTHKESISDKETWGCLFMFSGSIVLTVVFFVTDLEFEWYFVLMALNVLFFALVNRAIRSREREKEEEKRMVNLAKKQAVEEQQRLVAEKIKPVVSDVEQLILNAIPLEVIEEKLQEFTLGEQRLIIKISFLHVLDHLIDNVEISADYEAYIESIHTKYLSSELNITNHLYQEYIKNCTLSKVLRGEIPQYTINNCPLNLEANEVIIWVFNSVTSYQEVTKTINVGASEGLSVRIARGIYYRVGAFRGEPITTTNLKPLYYGNLIITNKNVYFYSTQKSVKYPYDKILAYVPFEDAIGIQQTRANSKTVYYEGIDGRYAFNLLTNIKNFS